jgi:trimethylamine--corrinoid protein Co-methyltransferase
MGICGADQAASLDILVMQHELIRFIESTMRDIDCSNEALALREIEEVGPGGIFLDRMHTAENFKKALWFPRLIDREYYQSWYDGRAEDMAQRCKRFKKELLSIPPKEILPNDLEKTFIRILSAAKRELEN